MGSDAVITLITPTGMRPEAFARCEHYIGRQYPFEQVQWIVVDDGTPPTKVTLDQTYLRGPKDWKEGVNTQRYNLDLALQQVKGEFIFFIEDDEFYSEKYISTYLTALNSGAKIVGEANAKYFSLTHPGYKEMGNFKHASLCQTAIHRDLLPVFEKALHSGELYIDIVLWKLALEAKIPTTMFVNQNLCIGIKGMPGRSGIGIGHRQKDYFYDPKLTKLLEWVPEENVEFYKQFVPQKKPLEMPRA